MTEPGSGILTAFDTLQVHWRMTAQPGVVAYLYSRNSHYPRGGDFYYTIGSSRTSLEVLFAGLADHARVS